MALEKELKLTAPDAATLERVLDSPLVSAHVVAGTERPPRRFHARYYDTPDGRLERRLWSLRARREGDRWKAALKTRGVMENGVSARQEYESPVAGWIAKVNELPAGELKSKLREALEESDALEPRVEVDVIRTARDLDLEGAVAELVTDAGTISAGERGVDLHEVELELKEGDFSLVERFGRRLAEEFGLVPSGRSKHEIGLDLLRGGPVMTGDR